MKISWLLLSSGLLCAGCARTTQTSYPTSKAAAQALVNSITGNARGSRDKARTLRTQSDQLLAAKNYTGAMDKRLQILTLGTSKTSLLGFLSSAATQSLALQDVATVASHLDATSCRKYAQQIQTLDAQMPTFAVLFQNREAEELKQLSTLTRTPQDWQKAIAGLGFTPQEQATLQKTPIPQIQTNIRNAYATLGNWAQQPYSSAPPTISSDPYTRRYAVSGILRIVRFVWTKSKTERVLTIEALLNRYERLQKQTLTRAPLTDPFSNGALNSRNDLIYSVGPDTKDDGGKSVPSPLRITPSDKGDILAPTF